ncbi:hypothetical protein IE3_03217 [Bacillus cereus BAG3X2-1]|nr:hypothetical protein IE3_03217 [Bacillus cereus BAG3X2-1]
MFSLLHYNKNTFTNNLYVYIKLYLFSLNIKSSFSTKDSKAINFNSVAKEAGVTNATLYNHSDIRERIEFLRNQQKKAYSNARVKRDEANQDAMIASLRRRIKKLEGRIEELEDENKKLRKTESTELANYMRNL